MLSAIRLGPGDLNDNAAEAVFACQAAPSGNPAPGIVMGLPEAPHLRLGEETATQRRRGPKTDPPSPIILRLFDAGAAELGRIAWLVGQRDTANWTILHHRLMIATPGPACRRSCLPNQRPKQGACLSRVCYGRGWTVSPAATWIG